MPITIQVAGYLVFDDNQPVRRRVVKGRNVYGGCIYERSTCPVCVFPDKPSANRVKEALKRKYRRWAKEPGNTEDTTLWALIQARRCFVRPVEITELKTRDVRAIEEA